MSMVPGSVLTWEELEALSETCARLKERLVVFTVKRRVDARRLAQSGLKLAEVNQFIDEVIHAAGEAGRPSVIDEFVDASWDLSADERDIVLGWKGAVTGVFEVVSRERRCARTRNLVDELDYGVFATSDDPAVWARLSPGRFILSRVVPVRDLWMLSGIQSLLEPGQEAPACEAAMQLAFINPFAVFRNPAYVEKAIELARATIRAPRAAAPDGLRELLLPPEGRVPAVRQYGTPQRGARSA